MKLAVPKERRLDERRVAATPDTLSRMRAMGLEVAVEAGAGLASGIRDSDYQAVGATLVDDEKTLLGDADIVLRVQRPLLALEGMDELSMMKSGAVLIGLLAPHAVPQSLGAYAGAGITAVAMELVPRISRAQAMDVLSSQASLAGYRAVVEAVNLYNRVLPMMMTAAGTLAAAKVMVLGAGVAGLQAIATARRLGAIVCATDVRAAAAEQVASLGARFVTVDADAMAGAETAGGYAREMGEDFQRRQRELVAETLRQQDIALCTALIPGRPAPLLITEDMVRSMKPGSVIVDLAVEQGGNCALSRPGEVVDVGGVRIIGYLNLPSRLAADASAVYARNLLNFIAPLLEGQPLQLKLDWSDEIVSASVLTHGGRVVHPQFASQWEES